MPAIVAASVYNPENVSGLFLGMTGLTILLFLALLIYSLILLATRGPTLGKEYSALVSSPFLTDTIRAV